MIETFTQHLKRFSVEFLVFLLFAILFACGDKKKGGEPGEFFNLNKLNLGIEVSDQELGIKFSPPKDWQLMPASISRKVESRSTVKQSDNFVYQPTYVFFNDSTGGLLSVGKVVTKDSTLAKSARLNYYKGLLSSKLKNNALGISAFVNSKINFTQFKIQKENLYSFKIIFENSSGEIIQFDYTIPAKFLDNTQIFMKSSIGSIGLM